MNYYDILDVSYDADIVELKAAYRKLARKFHPDVNPDGMKEFKEISTAYDTLVDVAKRKKYDTLNGIFKTPKQNTSSKKAEEEYNKAPKEESLKQEDKHFKNKKADKKIADMFNDFLESTKQKVKEEIFKPKDGSDINTDITITLSESHNGTNKTINIVRTELCPRCRGRKFINGAKCKVCSGSGEYSQHRKITVKIPGGIKNGAKLRIKNEGGEGQFGGKNGDLYLFIKIDGNSKIQYDDLNILYNVPITPYEAVLGGEIIVPAFDGAVKLIIPAKTTSGQKFRLAEQGLKRGGKLGDMIVTVTIEIPKRLSDDEVKLYEKLKKMSSFDIRENLLDE